MDPAPAVGRGRGRTRRVGRGLWVHATRDGIAAGRELARLVDLHAAYRAPTTTIEKPAPPFGRVANFLIRLGLDFGGDTLVMATTTDG
ncbi:MAG TPA: hypothetical protein VFT22_19270 [Kofleriaceae bacterium]|nr:hypothetical protein [Kofleriaceae bacterium]